MLIVTVSPVCAVAPVEKTENPSAASAPKEKKAQKKYRKRNYNTDKFLVPLIGSSERIILTNLQTFG